MQQLSNLDASFLYLESPRTPMHIGCILTFAAPKSGSMTFERFRRYIISRLPVSPVFRRRLAVLPFDIDRPYWVEVPDFDIDQHLHHIQIDGLDCAKQHAALTNEFFSQCLNPTRPLWAMQFVESAEYQQGEFTVLLKLHHAAVDGQSAEKILTGLLSVDPDSIADVTDTWTPEQPSMIRMISNRLHSWYHTPQKLLNLTQALGHAVASSRQLRLRDGAQQPPHFFTSPKSPFSQQIEPMRSLSSAQLSLSDIKAIKNAYPGTTVNDVVLTVCAGALRQYLLRQERLPTAPMVAMVPVSKRQGGETMQGNLVSPMLVALATDLESPVARLEAIRQNALQAKEYNREISLEQIINFLPSSTSAWFTKAYTRLRIGKQVNPIFNLIVTNVPGPAKPLYLDGAQLKSMAGMAPIVDGMGLTLVITSYLDTLTVAVTSTPQMAAHAPEFIEDLDEAVNELYRAVVMPAYQAQAQPICALG